MVDHADDDPILIRRTRYARLAIAGQRLGYLVLAVAIVAFIVGFTAGFPQATVVITVAGLIGACVLLPPAIIAGYAVKAAEQEDRDGGGHR